MKLLRCFIPSFQRAGIICTPKQFDAEQWYRVVVHSDGERADYARHSGIAAERIIVSHAPPTLGQQRHWILENLVDDDEWVLMADDNIRRFEVVDPKHYGENLLDTDSKSSDYWRRVYRTRADWACVRGVVEESIAVAERHGTRLIGFANNDNPFFRRRKWRREGFVCGKFYVVRRGPLRFDPSFTVKSDYDFSAAHMQRYGSVVINNFLFPSFRRFETGGVGPQQARFAPAREAVSRLLQKYPGLFRIKNKPGCAPGTEVVMVQQRN
ncbi:MAG: hypothetical protein UMS36scaffold28_55 [Phage 59_13]|nr:MAG: hypothetical protein UMS36scaffold28_55 [Phage 59_13]